MILRNKKFNLLSLDTLAYLLIIIYIIIFIVLSFGRHDGLKTYLNDLGTYDQIIWNGLHGKLFQSSGAIPAESENYNFLGAHFSPILLIFIPFYLIWANPKMLLLLQAVAVGLAGLPIYWIARDKIKSKFAGLVFLISYLFYPILHNALLYDFHEVTFAVPFITFALYFWHKKKYGLMGLFLALVCFSQEHLPLIVFMFGLYLMFISKKWKMGGIIAATSFIYFILIVTVLMPAFSTTGEIFLVKDPSGGATRYSWLGSSNSEILKTIFTKPIWVLKNIFSWRRIDFFITLFLPLFALPLFSALTILIFPILLIYFLSSFWLTYSVYYYHSAPLTGIIFIAAIFSFARLIKVQRFQKLFLALILIASILVSYFYTITPLSANYSWQDFKITDHAKLLSEVKNIIPEDATLSVQHNLGPYFTHRYQLYNLPKKIGESDYILIDAFNPYYGQSIKQFYSFGDILALDMNDWTAMVNFIFNDARYGLIYDNDGYFIFKKGAVGDLNNNGYMNFKKYLNNIVEDLEVHGRL